MYLNQKIIKKKLGEKNWYEKSANKNIDTTSQVKKENALFFVAAPLSPTKFQ